MHSCDKLRLLMKEQICKMDSSETYTIRHSSAEKLLFGTVEKVMIMKVHQSPNGSFSKSVVFLLL